MQDAIRQHNLILMEAAVVERIRRMPRLNLHPTLVNAPLIYTEKGRSALGEIYRGYMDIADKAGYPLMLSSPTWRTNQARVADADAAQTINEDAVGFLRDLRETHPSSSVYISGLIGCKNDCYRPLQGLPTAEATAFHSWQIERLVEAGVDVLIAQTLPAVDEALGIAKAMEATELPYFISFVIGSTGRVLDETSLHDAIGIIDGATKRPPMGYMINCAYPSFLCAATQPSAIFKRLLGYSGNASALEHDQLDGAADLQGEPVAQWAAEMANFHRAYGMKFLGGCCGTDDSHLQNLIWQLDLAKAR